MCGSLGIGGNLLEWSEEERNEAAYWISRYKNLREIIQLGDQYRLGLHTIQYMTRDHQLGVILAFNFGQPGQTTTVKMRLQGLDPEAIYEVEGFNEIKSGLHWMSEDIDFSLGRFESTLREIHQKFTN
jgi:alpha-galactosidase